MSWRRPRTTRLRRGTRDRFIARLSIERLEVRWLPTASPPVVEPNETIDRAEDLGTPGQPVAVMGSIGDGPAHSLRIRPDGIASTAGTVFLAGPGSGSRVGGADGRFSAFLSAPYEAVSVHRSKVGGLAFLGIHPLGTVDDEDGPAPDTPIRVAVSRSDPPGGRKRLARLVTLTSLISANREGEGTETATNFLEQPESAAIDETGSYPAVEATSEIDRPAAPERGITTSEPGERALEALPLEPAAQPALASNDAIPPGRTIRPQAAEAVEDRADTGPVVETGQIYLVITGVIVSAASWGRRAIRDLKLRRNACAKPPPSAGLIGRRPSWGGGTLTSTPSGKGCAPPHGIIRPVRIDGPSRSRVAR